MNKLIKPAIISLLVLATPIASAVTEYIKVLPHATTYSVHIVPNIRTATVSFRGTLAHDEQGVYFKFACDRQSKPVEVIAVESKKPTSPSLIRESRAILEQVYSHEITALCTNKPSTK